MSATRDKSQKITFVYSNLYQLYLKGKDAAISAELPNATASTAEAIPAAIHHGALRGVETAKILKAEVSADVLVHEYRPATLLNKRISRPDVLPAKAAPAQVDALASLKDNLKSLNDLHARLRFMLKELEELVKE